jgi:hypothetical protein
MVSLHPFVGDQQAIFDPSLVGTWTAENDTLYLIRPDGNAYKIRRLENNEAENLSAQLFKAGDLRILDLAPASEDSFQIAAHTPIRVWIDGATMRFAMLDSAWLKENAHKQLAVEDVGERALITAPPDAVLRFLTTYGTMDAAYEKATTLHKQQ